MSLQNLVGISLETITPSRVVVRLDALRKQRNLTEYTGDTIPEASVAECLSQAETLHATATAWLKSHRPDMM